MKKYLALSLLLFFTSVGFSQTYLISSYNGQTVNTCSGHTYDSGGAGGGYGNNQNLSMTIHSNNATSTHIRLFFFTFDVDPSDTLYIYDGPNITSPLLGAYNNTNSINGTALYASVLNGSGSLTLKFKSNGAAVGPG